MTDQGTSATMPLQAVRPEDRDPRERQHPGDRRKPAQLAPQHHGEPEALPEIDSSEEETHQLNERA